MAYGDGHKNYKSKFDGVKLKVIAFGEPRVDIGGQIFLKINHDIVEYHLLKKKVKKVINEWFLDTKSFIPEHFEFVVEGPEGYLVNQKNWQGKARSFGWKIDFACTLRTPMKGTQNSFEAHPGLVSELDDLIVGYALLAEDYIYLTVC